MVLLFGLSKYHASRHRSGRGGARLVHSGVRQDVYSFSDDGGDGRPDYNVMQRFGLAK
jgi:hypothetical protein